MIQIIQILIAVAMTVFAVIAFRDVIRSRDIMKRESGSMPVYCLTSVLAMFFGTFGVSDTAISVFLYKTTKSVDDRRMPGTIISASILPVGTMALAFLSTLEVDPLTLLICVAAQSVGAILGVKLIVRLDEHWIRMIMGIALIGTAALIVFKLFFFGLSGGEQMGLHSWYLAAAMGCFFVFGGLNMIGMGATVPNMAVLLLLGMSIKAIYPIVMTGNIMSCFFGAYKFVREGAYTRKAIPASLAGVLAVLAAVHFLKAMNVSILQIGMIALLLYCAVTMLREEYVSKRGIQEGISQKI